MKLWPFSKKSENPTVIAGGGVKTGKMELPPGVMLASPDEEPLPPKTIEMHPGVYQGKSTALASSVTENIPDEQKETEPSLADLNYIPIEEAPPTEEKTGKIDLSQFFEQHQLEVISQAPPISSASPTLPAPPVHDTPKPDSSLDFLQFDNAQPISPSTRPADKANETEAGPSFYLEPSSASLEKGTPSLKEMAAFLGTEDFSAPPSSNLMPTDALPDFSSAPPHTPEPAGLSISDAVFDGPIAFKNDFSTPESEQFTFFDPETMALSESTGDLNASLIPEQISPAANDLESPPLFLEEDFDAFEYPNPEQVRQPQPAPLNLSTQDLAPPQDEEAGSSEDSLFTFSLPATSLPEALENSIDAIFAESSEDLFTGAPDPMDSFAFSTEDSLPIVLNDEEDLPETPDDSHYFGDEAEGLKGDDNLDSYDFGHYSDPDEPEAAFVLDEADLVEEAPAPQETMKPLADFLPEKSLPTSPAKPEIPAQASAFTTSRPGKRHPETLADHLGSFEQETLLKDSRFLKKSIDNLVNGYFSRTEAENH